MLLKISGQFFAITYLLAGTSASFASVSEDSLPRREDTIEPLVSCPISLAAAKENLASLGYSIASSEVGSFSTHYKTSDRDSEKKLLGSYSIQRERQYEVRSTDGAAIRFSARYRETEYASEGRGNSARDKVREYPVDLSAPMVGTLKDMQAEVCNPAERKAAKEHTEKKSVQLDQYLRERCKAGDDTACQLLTQK